MYYDEFGDKDQAVIVFLNAAGSIDTFKKQYVLMHSYHLIIPHFYGIGREKETDYELDKTVEGVIDIIKQYEGRDIYLVGFSLGAAIAMKVLCKIPRRIRKAVIISGWFNASKLSAFIMTTLSSISYHIGQNDNLTRIRAKIYHLSQEATDNAIEYYHIVSGKTVKNWYKEVVRLKKNYKEYEAYKNISVPVLGLCGSREVKSIKKSLILLKGLNPHCTIEIWNHAGHNIPSYCGDYLTERLAEFFG